MTDDAAWLRARQEIVTACDEGMGEFAAAHTGTDECTDFNMTVAGIVRALPFLRAAIREDVVRELAGDDAGKFRGAVVGILCDEWSGGMCKESCVACVPLSGTIMKRAQTMAAAAHVQGYERAREENVAMARRWAATYAALKREHADDPLAASAFGTAAACANDIATELSEKVP